LSLRLVARFNFQHIEGSV